MTTMHPRRAFTLIEVAVSIGIVAIGILTMALFLPIALRTQQQARFQMYAGTAAMELIERFLSTQTINDYHPEANAPWDTPSGYRAMSPDLEVKSTTINAGFIPIPRAIAYRIDSPNDEIRKLLDQGGNIYFSNPRIVAVGARDGTTAKPLSPIDSQRMIIGIVGPAQQNALPCLPQKAWPYRVPYPSQPHGYASNNGDTKYSLVAEQWIAQDSDDMYRLMETDFSDGTVDWDGQDSQAVYTTVIVTKSSTKVPIQPPVEMSRTTTLARNVTNASKSGYLPLANYGWGPSENLQRPVGPWSGTSNTSNSTSTSVTGTQPDPADPAKTLTYTETTTTTTQVASMGQSVPRWVAAKGYVALALWYAQRKGLPASFILGHPTQQEIDTAARTPAQIYALRFLAHAGMCLTKHYSLEARPRLDAKNNLPGYLQGGIASWVNPGPLAVDLLKTPAHPGLRLGIAIPGDDRWDPTDPASVNDPDMVPGRTAIPTPFTLQNLWDLNPSTAGTTVMPAMLNWATVDAAHPYKTTGNPDYDAGPRWQGDFFVTHDMIVNWTETSLKVAMQNAAANPYDWSVPRPMNRPLFTDYPLLQWDLFPTAGKPVLSGTIAGTNGDPNIPTTDATTPDYQYSSGVVARQWRPVAAQTITNGMPGAAGTIGGNADNGTKHPWSGPWWRPASPPVNWTAMEGTPSQFNLTNRFSAAERCREIVVWTADWMSYVDCETAPSAPVDASRYPRQRPASGNRLDAQWWQERSFTQSYMGPGFQWGSVVDWGADQGLAMPFSDIYQTSFRNPELALLFIKDMNYPDGSPAVPTFHDVFPWTVGPALGHDHGANTEGTEGRKAQWNVKPWQSIEIPADFGYYPVCNNTYLDVGPGWGGSYPYKGQDPRPSPTACDPKKVFSGIYGADRNINNVLDRGPVPRSTLIRAVEVARYRYYDPRMITSMR